MVLGNDLVYWSGSDAREKETRSNRTRRFIDRILHEREHPLLAGLGMIRNRFVAVPLPRAHALWALWAAKEAAFKAAVKPIPGLPFSPRSIRIEFFPSPTGDFDSGCAGPHPGPDHAGDPTTAPPITKPLARGVAHVRDQVYEILWEYHEDFVHALALGPRASVLSNPGTHQFSAPWSSVVRCMAHISPQHASDAVRRMALRLLSSDPAGDQLRSELGIVRSLLTNGRLGPPAFHDGVLRDDLDLTLTHDGPWGAAGILHRGGPVETGGPGVVQSRSWNR